MSAHVGDRLTVSSNRVGQPAQEGEIVEVSSGGGGRERYRVRWSDGRESVVFPGSDASIAPATGPSPAVETRAVTVDLRLDEDTDQCEAKATMATAAGTFEGTGRARRNPVDPVVPLIGEELAIARSLADLATKLEEAASKAIAAQESRPLHLIP
jgi:hypothetical protein